MALDRVEGDVDTPCTHRVPFRKHADNTVVPVAGLRIRDTRNLGLYERGILLQRSIFRERFLDSFLESSLGRLPSRFVARPDVRGYIIPILGEA